MKKKGYIKNFFKSKQVSFNEDKAYVTNTG